MINIVFLQSTRHDDKTEIFYILNREQTRINLSRLLESHVKTTRKIPPTFPLSPLYSADLGLTTIEYTFAYTT